MQLEIEIKGVKEALEGVNADLKEKRRFILQAADAGVRKALDEHFLRRQAQPRKPFLGFRVSPQGFWFLNNGFSVREQIRQTVFTENTATIAIDSPALAHKLNPTPPVIYPGPGKKRLAIPLNDAAAKQKPRAFDLKLGRVEGHTGLFLLDKSTGQPFYFLAKQAQTPTDPNALPTVETLQKAACNAIEAALK